MTAPVLKSAQDRLADLLGCGSERRVELVSSMLQRHTSETASYWLQLGVSIGIATLGLALGSAAAIIGAMLIAPLMGPIIGMAMGLATGSPFLVFRSGSRVTASIVVVIAGAAVITLLLPFHEMNAEISARTTPTALDLLTAAFCALAGVYATLRSGSDTMTTAAGTSISISLVPPLCASGYGAGTESWSVATGAALLFLTNLTAIVVVGTVAFVAAGFNRIDVAALEQEQLSHVENAPVSRAVARRLGAIFGSRRGMWLRLLMPFVLLGAVYIPLREALNEVAWEVVVRAAARKAVGNLKQPIVDSRVRVELHQVEVAVVLVGSTEEASAAHRRMLEEILPVSGVRPHIEVLAVPDAAAFAGLESTLRAPAPLSVVPPPSPLRNLDEARRLVGEAVEKYWPKNSAGPILAIRMGVEGSPLGVRLIHHGAGLQRSSKEVLEKSLSVELDRDVRVLSAAIPTGPIVRNDDLQFVGQIAALLKVAAEVEDMFVCVSKPEMPPGRAGLKEKTFSETMGGILQPFPHVSYAKGDTWEVKFVQGNCPVSVDAGLESGVAEAGGLTEGGP